MTLEERLALGREIAARTRPRIVIDTSREEARRKSFQQAKRRSEALLRAKPVAFCRSVMSLPASRGSGHNF
jgi:hypothetical protein